MELDKIKTELDDLNIRMLQLMKEYINIKKVMEEVIKDGSLHLAKSRYIMGNRSVSVLQLPTEDSNRMAALTRINNKETEVEGPLIMELNRLSLNDFKKNESEPVRQRVKAKVNESIGENGSSNKKTDKEEPTVQDPLKWFGVLLPQNMKQAQQDFTKAIDYAVQCANLQLEMRYVQTKYEEYITKKKELSN